MKMTELDLKELTVNDLLDIIKENVRAGAIKTSDKVVLASDEEGNSFSPLVLRGISKDQGVLVFYPLYRNESY